MVRKGEECDSWIGLGRRCSQSRTWRKEKYCRLSCSEIGLGYEGDDCCSDDDDDDDDDDDVCIECSDDETPWMRKKGKDCSGSEWLLERRCSGSRFWTKRNYCQESCYAVGRGYEGDVCCGIEVDDLAAPAACSDSGSGCSESSDCCSGMCLGDERCA